MTLNRNIKKWAEAEVEYLQYNYLEFSNKEIAIKLDRTAKGTERKLSELGLRRPKILSNYMKRLANMGRVPSESTCEKIGRSRRGKKLEEIVGIDKAKQLREKFSKDRLGRKVWNTGLTKETDIRLAKLSRDMMGKGMGENNSMYGRKHTIKAKQIQREKRLHRVFPTKHTSIELAIANGLSDRGYAFYMSSSVEKVCQPDVIFFDLKIAVFCDGDYFHANPLKYERKQLDITQLNNVSRDLKQNKLLYSNGWSILRYWETDIKANTNSCVDEIENVILNKLGDVYE